MDDKAGLLVVVRGLVQGVGFRHFVRVNARGLGLTGYILNRPSGNEVEVLAHGQRQRLQELLALLNDGPPGSEVKQVEVNWTDYSADYPSFTVRR